jgi:hypothetical protein
MVEACYHRPLLSKVHRLSIQEGLSLSHTEQHLWFQRTTGSIMELQHLEVQTISTKFTDFFQDSMANIYVTPL